MQNQFSHIDAQDEVSKLAQVTSDELAKPAKPIGRFLFYRATFNDDGTGPHIVEGTQRIIYTSEPNELRTNFDRAESDFSSFWMFEVAKH